MKNLLSFLACIVVFNVAVYAQNVELVNDLNTKFRKFNLIKLDSRAELTNVKTGRGITLTIDGRRLTLSVIENDLRSADYKLTARTDTGDVKFPKPENTTYKGLVVGDNSSIVRLALDGRKIEGLILTRNSEYFIEPARTYSSAAAADDFVIYEHKDLINKKEIACPLVNKVEAGLQIVNAKFSSKPFNSIFAEKLSRSFTLSLPPGDRILNLSTDADHEYVKIFGGGRANSYAFHQAIASINETLNVIEGLYESTVDITFTIQSQGGWLVQDPYADGCGISGNQTECVLENFKNYWNNNRPAGTYDQRNAAILFTGKTTVIYNRAYDYGTICRIPSQAYAIMTGNFPVQYYGNYRYTAAAHEIAHLLNATHIGGQDLTNNPDCYNSILGVDDPNRPFYGQIRMCNFTINEVNTHIQQNSCLSIE